MDPDRILDDLAITPGEVIAITGTGGKTTLLWFLAGLLKARGKVIVSVTAKMFPPEGPLYDKLLLEPAQYDPALQSDHSVWLAAAGRNESGKLLGIDDDDVRRFKNPGGYLIMEADGSRDLPLKMWYDHEPPVPKDTSLTLGIIPATALDTLVSPDTVYNFQGFSELTGLKAGEPATPEALTEVILNPQGLFKHSPGRKILLINQCDTDRLAQKAQRLRDAVLTDPRHHELSAILCMSLKESAYENYSHYSSRRIIPENGTQ